MINYRFSCACCVIHTLTHSHSQFTYTHREILWPNWHIKIQSKAKETRKNRNVLDTRCSIRCLLKFNKWFIQTDIVAFVLPVFKCFFFLFFFYCAFNLIINSNSHNVNSIFACLLVYFYFIFVLISIESFRFVESESREKGKWTSFFFMKEIKSKAKESD